MRLYSPSQCLMLTRHTERCGKPPGAPVRYRAPHARAVVRRRATANAAAGEPGPLYEHFQGIVSALDDRALQRAALQGREAWLTDAIEQPIICASTGTFADARHLKASGLPQRS